MFNINNQETGSSIHSRMSLDVYLFSFQSKLIHNIANNLFKLVLKYVIIVVINAILNILNINKAFYYKETKYNASYFNDYLNYKM